MGWQPFQLPRNPVSGPWAQHCQMFARIEGGVDEKELEFVPSQSESEESLTTWRKTRLVVGVAVRMLSTPCTSRYMKCYHCTVLFLFSCIHAKLRTIRSQESQSYWVRLFQPSIQNDGLTILNQHSALQEGSKKLLKLSNPTWSRCLGSASLGRLQPAIADDVRRMYCSIAWVTVEFFQHVRLSV